MDVQKIKITCCLVSNCNFNEKITLKIDINGKKIHLEGGNIKKFKHFKIKGKLLLYFSPLGMQSVAR